MKPERMIEILAEEMINYHKQPMQLQEQIDRINYANSEEGHNIVIGHSAALTAIGRAVEEARKDDAEMIDLKNGALMHIAHTASNSRTQSRRLRWIKQRANYATENKPYVQEEFDMPKSAESNESLKAEIRSLRAEVERLKGYAIHMSNCAWLYNGNGVCTCGLEQKPANG